MFKLIVPAQRMKALPAEPLMGIMGLKEALKDVLLVSTRFHSVL